MFNMLFNSIGKKFSMIIIFVIIAICFIVFISLNFFGKIAQISDISKVVYNYEVLCGHAKFDFEKFVTTNNFEYLNSFDKTMKSLMLKESAMVDIHHLLKQGLSTEEAVIKYQSKVGSRFGQKQVAKLIETLMGNPVLTNVLSSSSVAHKSSSMWYKLSIRIHLH